MNRVTHFTHWTVAHSHVGGYAFVTFVAFGAMYYIVPRVVGHEWPSEKLVRWHFNTVLAGIAIYVISLTWAGVAQGLALLDARLPFSTGDRFGSEVLGVPRFRGAGSAVLGVRGSEVLQVPRFTRHP